MGRLNKVTEHLRAYAYGEPCAGMPNLPGPHAFDLSTDDARVAICGLGLLDLIATFDVPKVTDSDRNDLIVLCRNLNSLKALIKEVDK